MSPAGNVALLMYAYANDGIDISIKDDKYHLTTKRHTGKLRVMDSRTFLELYADPDITDLSSANTLSGASLRTLRENSGKILPYH